MVQNVPLKCIAVKNLNLNIQKWQTAAILKIEKLQYSMLTIFLREILARFKSLS